MLFHKKRPTLSYNPATQEPAVRRSICTGEMTAGLVDRQTGKFQELMRIDSIEEFKRQIGAEDVKILY